MNLQKAIQRAQVEIDLHGKEFWFRPGSWSGRALCFDDRSLNGGLVVVPDFSGGRRWWPRIDDLLAEDWELVEPEVVIQERSS